MIKSQGQTWCRYKIRFFIQFYVHINEGQQVPLDEY